MSNISKLKKGSQDFITQLALGDSKSNAVTLAIARSLAYSLTMPSAKIDNLAIYFNNTYKIDIENFLFDLNEMVLIDVRAIIDLIYKFFYFRYNSIYPDNSVIALNEETGLVDFFALSKYFSPENLKTIQTESIKLTRYCLKINMLMEELGYK